MTLVLSTLSSFERTRPASPACATPSPTGKGIGVSQMAGGTACPQIRMTSSDTKLAGADFDSTKMAGLYTGIGEAQWPMQPSMLSARPDV